MEGLLSWISPAPLPPAQLLPPDPSLCPGLPSSCGWESQEWRREGGRGQGASQELLRTHSSSSSCPAQPLFLSMARGWSVGHGSFYLLHFPFSKCCIDSVSDIRTAQLDVMQNTKYYLRISHEYFWITQLWNYQLKITTGGAEWDRADTATRAGQSHDRGKLEKIRP